MKRTKPLLLPELVGARMRDLRLEKGFSLKRMHKLGGPTPSQMSTIERGKADFTIETLLEISKVLGVLPSKLLPDDIFEGVKWGEELAKPEPIPTQPKPWIREPSKPRTKPTMSAPKHWSHRRKG